MCGILGAATRADESPVELVAGALGRLRHRGPEAEGYRALHGPGTACVLGHTRLRIIDTSEDADQPLANEDGTVWISFNGELYGFPALRADLESRGHRFSSAGDTEVLVHLYEDCDGDPDRMLPRLRGMFAFALFDTKRGRLLLARDRLGIKPMYRARLGGGGIAFGSEARALAMSGLVPCAPDSAALIGYLQWGSVQGPSTAFLGVREVPPGSYVVWDAGGERTVRWWRPAFVNDGLADSEDAAEALGEALRDSVALHLVADREVGLFLSSGVDSGAIARTAASAGAVRSLTVRFPEGPDEGRSAASLAARLGLRHEQVAITGRDLAEQLDTAVQAMDQPTSDGVNTWVVSKAARESGLVVALSGVGGDELFGGYATFRQVLGVERAARVLRLAPARARRLAADLAADRWPGGRAARGLTAEPSTASAYRAVRSLLGPGDLARLGVLGWVDQRDAVHDFGSADPGPKDPTDRVAMLEMDRYLRNQLLRDTDVMSMAHSLEVRVPLLDDRVVEVALNIPARVRNAPGKALLRRAVGATDEPGPKLGFTMPFDRWMRGPLSEPVREALLSEDLPLAWLLSADGRAGLWKAFQERRVHWSRPWAVAMLRLWAGANDLRW